MPAAQPLTPEFRAWLEQERLRGRREMHAINRQRRLLPTDSHGLGRFAIRMALVDLTGSAARWSRVLHGALLDAGLQDVAAAFAAAPPFAATDPGPEDCDRLHDWVQARTHVLDDLLADRVS
jgi:hypothetical protein